MELYFLDGDFTRRFGPIDEAISIVWSLRFFECGRFRILFKTGAELLSAVREAHYVCTEADESGIARCGRIEYVGCVGEDRIEVSGRMLECLLADRVAVASEPLTGSVTEAVCAAVSSNLRGLPLEIAAEQAEIAGEVALTCEWESLSDWVYRALKPYGASYAIALDAERAAPVFRIVLPGEEATAIFSSSFENIAEATYECRSEDMKNAIYVEGDDGTVELTDLSDGKDRREIYRSANDVRPGRFDGTTAYREALKRRGITLLEEYPREEYVSCAAARDAEPVFGTDYRLGDLCRVEDTELGISILTRVTEADEVWENGEKWIYPAFGERIPGIKNKLTKG